LEFLKLAGSDRFSLPRKAEGAMATVSVSLEGKAGKGSNALAYGALVVFSFLYFARPEDLIPGMNYVPIEKITGGIAFLALFFGIQSRASFHKWPRELKLLAAMFGWQFLCVPFSFFISGALAVVLEKCIKALIVGLLVGLVVDSISQLRRLIFIQASSVAFMTFVSVLLYKGGRMGGVLGGVFDNPNDLAMNIALNFPLCLMFLMLAKNAITKLVWFAGLILMGRGLMLTYSRSGFLALAVAVVVSLWEFGIRNKRHYLLGAAAMCAVALLIVGPQSYGDRIKSIVSDDVQVYGDAKEARYELLIASLQTTARRPLFGVGPGQFAAYTGMWHVTHNTYTELSSECGIPTLVLFLLVIRECFRNLVRIRRTAVYAEDPNVRMYTSALWAGLASYLVGAAFASTAYQLFPYFMVGYTTALLRLCGDPAAVSENASAKSQETVIGNLPGWMLAPRRLR
jgi:O-antigen ligase/polysaccharide polymerase Wzy-like membrane protein